MAARSQDDLRMKPLVEKDVVDFLAAVPSLRRWPFISYRLPISAG